MRCVLVLEAVPHDIVRQSMQQFMEQRGKQRMDHVVEAKRKAKDGPFY